MSPARTVFAAIVLTAFVACQPVLGPEVNPVEQSESVVGTASSLALEADVNSLNLSVDRLTITANVVVSRGVLTAGTLGRAPFKLIMTVVFTSGGALKTDSQTLPIGQTTLVGAIDASSVIVTMTIPLGSPADANTTVTAAAQIVR